MQMITTGLVLRATKTGEADRVLSILTPEHGIISAIAKGSLRLKSKLFSATGLFCYSEFELFEGKSMFVVDNASVKELFWGIHQSVEGMALGMYFSEFISTLSPVGAECAAIFKLFLNTLYFLSKNARPPLLLKAVFELRALSLTGFLPALTACSGCVKYEGGPFFFDVSTGLLYCADCARERGLSPNLDAAALRAMRHIMLCDTADVFRFQLAEESTRHLAAVSKSYVLQCLDKPFKTEDFLNTILGTV